MTFENVQLVIQGISTASDLTTLFLNIKQLGTRITGKTFVEIQKDIATIEGILNECFVRKEVLWQKMDYEDFNWCINSLIDLQKKCDNHTSNFLTANDDKNHFYSQLMRLWGDYCNETYKELYRNKDGQTYNLSKPLKKLRKEVYKIVITLGQLLPNGNLTKKQVFEKLEIGCKNTKLTIPQIIPQWTMD
jgi:hypothetical protein